MKHRQPLFAALSAVALAACFTALLKLHHLKQHVVETIALLLLAGVLYLVALYLLEHSLDKPATLVIILLASLAFRALLLPLPPEFSDDIHRYRWEGRVQQAGFNPYAVAPDDPRLRHLRDAYFPILPGQDIASIYPPLLELTFRAATATSASPVGMKWPAVLGDLAILGLLAWWIKRSGGGLYLIVLYAWNPLVIFESAAGGHYDFLAAAALLACCLFLLRAHGLPSTLLLTAAALWKAFPAVLFPLVLRRGGRPYTRDHWWNAAAALALALLIASPFRDASANVLVSLADYSARWKHNNASLFSLLAWWSGSEELARGVGIGIVAALALWAAARKLDGVRAAYLLVGTILLFSPNAFPWYFTWIVPFLCFLPNPAWILLTLLQPLSYHVLLEYHAGGRWEFQPLFLWLTYAPCIALLLAQRLLPRKRIFPGVG